MSGHRNACTRGQLLHDNSEFSAGILTCQFNDLAIVPLGVVLFAVFDAFTGPTARQVIIQRDSLKAVSGKIDTLYKDRKNHNAMTAILTKSSPYIVMPEWESKINIGDSLYKRQGSLLLEVYKENLSPEQ